MNHIVRVSKSKGTPYVILDKRLTENAALSYGARGMMAYLLSKPDNWQVRMTDLENSGTEGRQRIRSIFQELESAGYLRRERRRTSEGQYIWETTIYEEPVVETHDTDSHRSVPTDGNTVDVLNTQPLCTHQDDTGVPVSPPVSSNKNDKRAEQNAIRTAAAEYFTERTRLSCPTTVSAKTLARLWWNPLREICALADWDIKRAQWIVDESLKRLEGLTVSDPNSILKTARSVAASRQSVAPTPVGPGGAVMMPSSSWGKKNG